MQATNSEGTSAGENPMDGLQGRSELMAKLGEAIKGKPEFFGPQEDSRPGNIVDYLLSHPTTTFKQVGDAKKPVILLETLWDALMAALEPVWPKGRTLLGERA